MAYHDEFLGIIESVYDAALDPSEWQSVLTKLSEYFNCTAATFFLVDRVTGEILYWLDHNVTDEGLQDYLKYYASIDPRINHAVRNGTSADVFYDYMHTSEEEMKKSDYYDWLDRLGMRYYMASTTLHDPKRHGFVSLQRTQREGHVEQADIEVFSQIAPHVYRATSVNNKLGSLISWEEASYELLDQLPYGVVVLDESRRCIYFNEAALRIVNSGDVVRITDQGELSAIDTLARTSLDEAIGRATMFVRDSGSTLPSGAISIRREEQGTHYVAFVLPINRRLPTIGQRAPTAVVLIRDPNHELTVTAEAIQASFDLTPAESKLVAGLCEGQNLQTCAKEFGVSVETVRAQLKSSLAKTRTHQQSEIVSLVLRALAAMPLQSRC